MKLITTKREHNASIKFIKKACEEIRPLVKDEKTVAKINQLLATPMLWDDVAGMLKTPIIVDKDGSAIYLDGETIVIDVPEVVGLKGLVIAEHMLGFVTAVAKPIGAILVTLSSLKDVVKAAGEHFKKAAKSVDNYSVMSTSQLIVTLRQRECGISELNMTDAEMADILRSLDRVEAARVATAEASVKKAAAELAAFEHDAAKPDTVEEL